MLYNDAVGKGVSGMDYLQVMWNGISLDAATAGYLTALPFLVVLVSVWLKKIPLKKILLPYTHIVAYSYSLCGGYGALSFLGLQVGCIHIPLFRFAG